MDPYLIEELLGKFVEWIDSHDEIPKNLDRILLVRYLKSSEFNLERAKQILYKSLELRSSHPQIFTNRDPFSAEIQKVIDHVQLVPLVERTEDNRRVSIIRMTTNDANQVNFNNSIKAFYMAADIRLATMDEVWADGEVPIFDMTNTSWRHIKKIVFSTLRLFMKYNQECHPVKVRQVHIVNCNYLIDKILTVLKPMMSAEVSDYIYTHLPGSDTLYDYVPRDILPKEYGGTAGSITEMRNVWLNYLDSYRAYLKDDDRFRLLSKDIKRKKN